MAHFFGIDIGGSNVKIGLVDSKKGLLQKIKYPTAELTSSGDFVDNFSLLLKGQFEQFPEVKKIGIHLLVIGPANRKAVKICRFKRGVIGRVQTQG